MKNKFAFLLFLFSFLSWGTSVRATEEKDYVAYLLRILREIISVKKLSVMR